MLSDWAETADCVLIDAPCSGTGTWRRNPEARWRLTQERIERLTRTQRHVLETGATLVKPGGALVYIVCSLLDEEGAGQVSAFLADNPEWSADTLALPAGRAHGAGIRLTPAHDADRRIFCRTTATCVLARGIVPRLELIMRYSSVAAAAALTLLAISTSLHGQRPDDQIDPRSMALLAKGKAAQASGNLDAATDALESALAVDPRNRVAFVTLGQVAEARGLPGKAIRLYREALLLEPNDVSALEGTRSRRSSPRSAVARAKDNLAKIRTICGKAGCADATVLAATIAKGPPIATASVEVPAVKPGEGIRLRFRRYSRLSIMPDLFRHPPFRMLPYTYDRAARCPGPVGGDDAADHSGSSRLNWSLSSS